MSPDARPSEAWILDGRYTFETFVVGSGNRLAYAAAKSVAQRPGEGYSPLLVYSESGLGKTHLLAAIGRRVLGQRRRLGVRYASLESLTAELLGALERGELENLRAALARLDVLLLDDLQFVAAHPRMQRELLRLLEPLGREGRQIVLASDRGPDRIEALDRRLLARLRAGLVVDIQGPDCATRAAILRAKSKAAGEELSPEAVDDLTLGEFANVRELEGALRKRMALPSLDERPITVVRVLEPPRPPLPHHRFAEWVTTPANRQATEAAQRVLTAPGARWSPLFVHAPTGMGKTHLLNALGNAFLERSPAARVCCQSVETMTDELIAAIQKGTLGHFRERYATADLLLLDDVQGLAGRERTQEEVVRAMNELRVRGRRVVLSADRPPGELGTVERRLVSRFERGLVVAMGELDEESAARALTTFLRAGGLEPDERLGRDLARRLRPSSMREARRQAERAVLRAGAAGATEEPTLLRRVLLGTPPPPAREAAGANVDPFFTDRYKVFLHWEPLADRLSERM